MRDDLVLDGLAIYRLSRLVVADTIFDEPRGALLDRLNNGGPVARKAAEGLDCPWCVSIWIAGGALVVRARWPRFWRGLSWVLAGSAVAGLLSGHEFEPDEMTVDLHDESAERDPEDPAYPVPPAGAAPVRSIHPADDHHEF